MDGGGGEAGDVRVLIKATRENAFRETRTVRTVKEKAWGRRNPVLGKGRKPGTAVEK